MKKCILYVLSFVLLSTGLSIGYSDRTHAQTGGILPLCQTFPAFNDLLEQEERYHADNTGWIAFRDDSTGNSILVVQWDTTADRPDNRKLRIAGTPQDPYLVVNQSTQFYIIPGAGPGGSNLLQNNWEATGNTSGYYTSLNCIEQVKNLHFEEDYLNAGGYTYTDRNRGGDSPTQEPIAHKPNITWDVMDKNVTVYSDSQKNTASLENYQIYWFISNTTFDTRQPSEPFALSGCTAPDFDNNFTVPIHFDYGIQAYYADEDCNILQVDDEGNQLSDNMVRITIDGSNFSGSTDDHEAIIGEIPENPILKAIRKFRPTDGGLSSLIFAPIEAVASLPDIVGTCTPISLPLLGESVSLKCIRPTIQQSPMGPVYSIISVIITGMVTWFVAWRTFGTIKNIQDPQDDKVEVLKL